MQPRSARPRICLQNIEREKPPQITLLFSLKGTEELATPQGMWQKTVEKSVAVSAESLLCSSNVCQKAI